MNELLIIEILLMALLFPAVVGLMYMKDFIMRYILNRTKIIVLRKDGTYIKTWKKIGSSKSINVDKRERLVDPRGRFIGPEGNLFVFVGESSKPATVEELQSSIDTDDVSTIATLSYFAGKIAGLKNLEQMQLLLYLNLVAVAMVGILLAMYWQDRTQYLHYLQQGLAYLKTLAHP